METLRKADLASLSQFLRKQREQVVDFVAPARRLGMESGRLIATIPDRGETSLTLTDHAKGQLAEKLGVPLPYYKRMEAEEPSILDANVNGWLRRTAENRLFMVRGVLNGGAFARAFLSDRYRPIDNHDVLLAALGKLEHVPGIRVESADVTETKMYVRLYSEALAEEAAELLKNYRAPGIGAGGYLGENHERTGRDYPLVFAGFILSNSEVGAGAFSLMPRLVLQVCMNGAIVQIDVLRRAHLGGRLDEGAVAWSQETLGRNLALISSQTADAVATFMSRDYVRGWIASQERAAGAQAVTEARPIEAVKLMAQERGGLTVGEADAVLARFMKSGDTTAFGFSQAVTAYAQDVASGDRAHELEVAAPVLAEALASPLRN